MDLWGPMQQSLNGCTYALLLVDEHSSYTWGYFLQYKSQVAELVMQFIREQERAGNKIQFVRTDRGGNLGQQC